MSGDRIELSATSLRGIAHPLRVRILGLLREHGPATATLLADRLGQSTGATSYHLRQLAAYGFVEEDPERGSGRERWWRAAHRSTTLERDAARAAPAEAEAYLRSVAVVYAERMERWLSEEAAMPPRWQDVGTLSDQQFRLTPDEVDRLHADLAAVFDRYRKEYDARDAPESVPDGAAPVSVQWQVMPFPPGDEEAAS
jgi:DNA-binding transcriptional ArsR family regulator